MAKQIVANNGELPPSVALSVAIKPIPNVGAKNIRSLPRGRAACAAQRARGSTSAGKGTGAEYDGVSHICLMGIEAYDKHHVCGSAVHWRWLQLQEVGF